MAPIAAKPSTDLTILRTAIRAGRLGPYLYVALLGLRRYDPLSIDSHIRRGFAYSAFERFSRNTELPLARLAEVTGIPTRTLARRKEEGRLDVEESDRLARVSRLFARALELFEGEATNARDWLTRPQSALGGRIPLELASTDIGAQEVERLIGRLEYGIPT
jgi:putative toxin-antitoxin system antitoxin component (TIGR02293 family)